MPLFPFNNKVGVLSYPPNQPRLVGAASSFPRYGTSILAISNYAAGPPIAHFNPIWMDAIIWQRSDLIENMQFSPNSYPATIRNLLAPLEDLRFDFSQNRDDEAKRQLARLSFEGLNEGSFCNENAARCCLSGLWLLHGFLDESHEISQSIHTAEGSFWHAIMHRAEGDFWNSKYWYRKIGPHTVLTILGERDVAGEDLVDLCEAAHSDPAERELANRIAKREWSLLFEACWHSSAP